MMGDPVGAMVIRPLGTLHPIGAHLRPREIREDFSLYAFRTKGLYT